MREINSRTHGGAARSIDRRDVVVHLRVAVERKPIAEERQPPGEVESAKTRAGIARVSLLALVPAVRLKKLRRNECRLTG